MKSSIDDMELKLKQIFKIDDDGRLNFIIPPKKDVKNLKKAIISFFVEYFYMNEDIRLKEFMESLERAILMKILSKFNGNQKNTAEFLGLNLTTLNQKIKRHNIRFRKRPIEG